MNIEEIQSVIKSNWNRRLGEKALRYVDRFSKRELAGKKISAEVKGNHGTYRVSITVNPTRTESVCSCYIGKGGGCHHCAALAHTFLRDPESFQVIRSKQRKQIKTLEATRNQKRRSLFDAQDQIDRQRAELIAQIEEKLEQKVEIAPLFTIRWQLG